MKKSILEAIGNTPIVQLQRAVPDKKHSYFAKIEYLNPGGSIKDRIAVSIINEAEKRGDLKPGGTIVEATSGNTGSGLALVAAVRGYKAIFCMPEKISEEKRAVLRAYGAKVVITPNGLEPEHPNSFYSVAKKLSQVIPNSFYTNQYHNPDNVKIHYETTGPEIWEQSNGQIDVFVAGAGTGGTLSGVGRYLKEKNPAIKVVMADPIGSILYDLYYHKEVRDPVGSYIVEGIGEDMLPDNVHFNVIDAVVKTDDFEAFDWCRKLAAQDGLLVGPSAGSILAAAGKFVAGLQNPQRVFMALPDSGKSYLSKAFNPQFLQEKGLVKNPLAQHLVENVLASIKDNQPKTLEVGQNVKDAIANFARNQTEALAIVDGKIPMGYILRDSLVSRLKFQTAQLDTPLLRILDGPIPKVPLHSTVSEAQDHLHHFPFLAVGSSELFLTRGHLLNILVGDLL